MRFGTLAASVMAELVVFNAAQMGAEMISPLNRHNIFQKIGLAFLCLSILSTSDTFKAAIVGRSRRCRRTKQASGGRSRRFVPPAWIGGTWGTYPPPYIVYVPSASTVPSDFEEIHLDTFFFKRFNAMSTSFSLNQSQCTKLPLSSKIWDRKSFR